MAYSQWSKEAAQTHLATTCDKPGPILISLQSLQQKFGYVHSEDVPLIAQACNVSKADVHGVLTFYHDLRTTPPPKKNIRICVAEACQAVGSRELVAEAEEKFGTKIGHENPNIEITADYCLGNCALGPSSMVNGELLGFTSVAKIEILLNSGER
jgi:formate dehydrogenase subunit gamma